MGTTFYVDLPTHCPETAPNSTSHGGNSSQTKVYPFDSCEGKDTGPQSKYMESQMNAQEEEKGKFSTMGMSLLVVDDSKSNRKMLCRLLTKKFAVCEEACDGLEAVERVKEALAAGNPFNAILMDFVMPNMDGPTATKSIRELGYRGIIIGVTGNALQSDITTFTANGADRVLTKPLDVNLFEIAMLGECRVPVCLIICFRIILDIDVMFL